MEIIVCAMECEISPLKNYFGNKVKFFSCGIKAKNLDFLKTLSANDHITNIGVCGGTHVGKLYLANKIIGDKTYYPDNLIKTEIPQTAVKTISHLANTEEIKNNPDILFEQEAAIIFKEASKYIGPHQMSFLKIVSDSGLSEINLIENFVSELIENKILEIENYINSSKAFFRTVSESKEPQDLEQYAQLLKCSVTMKNRLEAQLRYAEIANIEVTEFFNTIEPIMDKKQALSALDSLNQFLINRIS